MPLASLDLGWAAEVKRGQRGWSLGVVVLWGHDGWGESWEDLYGKIEEASEVK